MATKNSGAVNDWLDRQGVRDRFHDIFDINNNIVKNFRTALNAFQKSVALYL